MPPANEERRALRAVWRQHQDELGQVVGIARTQAETLGFPLIAVKLGAVRVEIEENAEPYSHLARESYEITKLQSMFLLIGQPGMQGALDNSVPVYAALNAVVGVFERIDREMHEAIRRVAQMRTVFA